MQYNNDEIVIRTRSLQDVFNALNLPEPGAKDLAAIQMGSLVALEDYGAVLRIERYAPEADYGTISTAPCSLQPICSFEYSEGTHRYRVRLLPGIARVGITERDHEILEEAFAFNNHVLLKDPKEKCNGRKDDCGYITCTIDGRVRVLPILFDITDTRRIAPPFDYRLQLQSGMFSRGQELCALLARAQDILYGELKDKCRAMLCAGDGGPNPAYDFWAAMREATKNKSHGGFPPLHASWKKASCGHDPDCKAEMKRGSLVDASENYAIRLHMHDMHSEILRMRAPAAA